MKKETFIRIGKRCAKGDCDPMCPHRGKEDCRMQLIRDAVKLMATDVAAKRRDDDA